MGAFFTNVLVRTKSVAGVATAVDRALHVEGWQSLSDEADGLARRVLLVPAGEWVAVYDEGTEAQETAVLDRLAADLSGFLGAAAVATLVHDSDYLLMQVFDAGDSIGFVERGVDGPTINEGGFAPWRRIFPDLPRVVAADAVKRKHTFVEDNLRELAAAIGLPVDAVSTGFEYSAREDAPRSGSRTLRYTPVPFEAPKEPDVSLVHATDIAAERGEAVEWDATFRNHGAAFCGLRVTAHEPEGLLLVDRVRVTVGGPLSPTPLVVEETTFDPPRSLVEPVTVDFGDLALPAGAPAAHLRKLKLLGFEGWARVAMPTLISVDVRFVATASGAGRVTLAASPLSRAASQQHDVACVVA